MTRNTERKFIKRDKGKQKSRTHKQELKNKGFYHENEQKVYGINLCRQILKSRPQAIKKIYLHKDKVKLFQDMTQFCVKNKKAYKLVSDEDLLKLTESRHNEGICLIVDARMPEFFSQALKRLEKNQDEILVYLNGVGNPHNIGNILRTSAHFGVKQILVDSEYPKYIPAATQRVSEGGSEFVNIIKFKDPITDLNQLKEMGYEIIGTSSHTEKRLEKFPKGKKVVLVLGNEISGITQDVKSLLDELICIPGTGHVESLNVASTYAVMLGMLLL